MYAINPLIGVTPDEAGKGGILQVLFAVALLLPYLSVAVRRLQDIGKSGWWILLAFIPIIGALVLVYFYVTDSQEGSNLYGENPKSS